MKRLLAAVVLAGGMAGLVPAAWEFQFRLWDQTKRDPSWNEGSCGSDGDRIVTSVTFNDYDKWSPSIYSVVDFHWNYEGSSVRLPSCFEVWMPGDPGWVQSTQKINPELTVQTEGTHSDTSAAVNVHAQGAVMPADNVVRNFQNTAMSQKKRVVLRVAEGSMVAKVATTTDLLRHWGRIDGWDIGQGDDPVFTIEAEGWHDGDAENGYELWTRITFVNHSARPLQIKMGGVTQFDALPAYSSDHIEWYYEARQLSPRLEVWETFQVGVWGWLQDAAPMLKWGFHAGFLTY